MNDLVTSLNHWSAGVGRFGWSILWQSSALIGAVYFIDLVLRKKVAANFRYLLWLLVLVKLFIPPGFASPTSAAWWLRSGLTGAPRPNPVVVTFGPLRPPPLAPAFAPAARPPARETLSLPSWAVLVSAGMSFALLAFATNRWDQLRRHARSAAPAPPWLQQIAESAQQQIGLKTEYRMRMDSGDSSPALFGLLRPIILLPQALAERLSPAQIRAVLLHELLHLKRCDVWVHCAQTLLQIVFWWHPLLWFANRRMRAVREEAVDDSAMTALRSEAEIYPPTLLEVAKLAIHRPLSGLGMVGILESRNVFRKRIERLLAHSAPPKKLTMLSFIGLMLFSAVALPMGQAPARPVKEAVDGKQRQSEGNFSNENLRASSSEKSPLLLLPSRNTDKQDAISSDDTFGYEADIDEQSLADRRLKASAESRHRVFRVDPDTTRANLLQRGLISRETPEIGLALCRLLVDAASSTREENPLNCFYGDREGVVIIRGSERQIGLAAQALEDVSPTKIRDLRSVGSDGSPKTAVTTSGASTVLPISRAFITNPDTIRANLQSLALIKGEDSEKQISRALSNFLSRAASAKHIKSSDMQVVYSTRDGELLLRGSLDQIETLAEEIYRLNTPIPQVNIKTKFVELLPEDSNATTVESLVKSLIPRSRIENPVPDVVILSPKDTALFLDALGKRKGADLKWEASVTTLSGRQTEVQSVDEKPVVTGQEPQSGNTPKVESVSCGSTLDVMVVVSPNSRDLTLVVDASDLEFLGYASARGDDIIADRGKAGIRLNPPSPRFRVRKFKARDVEMLDGQTVILRNSDANICSDQYNGIVRADTKAKPLFILVTVVLIDATGSPVHSTEKVPPAPRRK